MIDTVLQGFVKLQKTGFKWDLFHNGKLHKGVEFKPFVAFTRADMEEADKICGAFKCRSLEVAQLCQKCGVPARETNDHLASCPPKTAKTIDGLCRRKDPEGSRAL